MTPEEKHGRFLGNLFVVEQLLPATLLLALRMQPDPQKALSALREGFGKALSKAVEDGGQYGEESEKFANQIFEAADRALRQGTEGSQGPVAE